MARRYWQIKGNLIFNVELAIVVHPGIEACIYSDLGKNDIIRMSKSVFGRYRKVVCSWNIIPFGTDILSIIIDWPKRVLLIKFLLQSCFTCIQACYQSLSLIP